MKDIDVGTLLVGAAIGAGLLYLLRGRKQEPAFVVLGNDEDDDDRPDNDDIAGQLWALAGKLQARGRSAT